MKHAIEGLPSGISLLKYSPPCTAQVSYLLSDRESRTAAVIDPERLVDPYLEDAWRLDAQLKHVFLTRLDGEEPSGAIELRERTDATIYVGAWGRPAFEFMPLKDGDAFEFGRVRVQVFETPGQRLESILLLVSDRHAREPAPLAALTGRTVLLGDVGRPEPRPQEGLSPAELGAHLYESIRKRVLPLPEAVRVLPSQETFMEQLASELDTVEAQRRCNPGLQPMTRDEFVSRITMGMADLAAPRNGAHLRLRPASAAEALRAQRAGAQVVDVRDPSEFALAHWRDSLNLPAVAAFEDWAGGLLERERPILLIAPPGDEGAAAVRLHQAGFDQVACYLREGIAALRERPDLIRRRRRLSFAALRNRIEVNHPLLLLDTRPESPSPAGPPVAGLWIPLERLELRVPLLPRAAPIVVCDDTPYRSSAAASFLAARGFEQVTDVAGGLALWGGA